MFSNDEIGIKDNLRRKLYRWDFVFVKIGHIKK